MKTIVSRCYRPLMTVEEELTLLISGVERKDEGLYVYMQWQLYRSGDYWMGHITVELKPSFEGQPDDKFWTCKQKTVNLSVSILPFWMPRFNSSFVNILREDDKNLEVLSRGPSEVLRVYPLGSSYFNRYTCKAINTKGVSYYNVTLLQVQNPGPMSSVQTEKVTLLMMMEWTWLATLSNFDLKILLLLLHSVVFWSSPWYDVPSLALLCVLKC